MQPFSLLAKPTGPICNLDCEYCFFLSKEMLYPGDRFRMADDLLQEYVRQLLESQPGPEVTFAWQGGEPTMMGLDFYRRLIELVDEHRRPDQQVAHTIQTNATLLNDDWAAFFKEHNFLVGVSIDGPQHLHDTYRVDKRGIGSFDRVIGGYEVLRRHEVDVNILCTVNAANQDHPMDVYRFLRDDLNAQFIQFIPVVERVTDTLLPLANLGWSGDETGKRPLYIQAGDRVTDRSVSAHSFGRFLITIFDEWIRNDIGQVYVQHFDVALASWHGVAGGLCIFAETCGGALAMEHNGDLYSCDHYVEPDYLLGNITEMPLAVMVQSEEQRAFGMAKLNTLPDYCRTCEVRFACNGGCPKNRFTMTPDGDDGLNYLCAGYKRFFTHIDEPMRIMSDLLSKGLAPALVGDMMSTGS
jgi:uncharacterized protein